MTGGVVAHNPVLVTLVGGVVRPAGARAARAAVHRRLGAALFALETTQRKEDFAMLIQEPARRRSDRRTSGCSAPTAYPRVPGSQGEREAAIFEGGIGAIGPLLRRADSQSWASAREFVQAGRRHPRPSRPRDGHSAVAARCFPASRCVASAPAAATLAAEKAVAFFRQIDDALTGSLLKAGHDRRRHTARRRWPRTASPSTASSRRATRSRSTAPRSTVLETPGHSDCSLSFHEPAAADPA